MEYFVYVIAAALAGIGTGLAGLSAATVMVPILIVLCPSFAGETGAYQATAIALASDILGSAVTTGTYIKHKNIDLKRGWIMLVCILSMCTVGSYVAWLAGNVVLGGFTLFLTFCIGIRFLVKPSTERDDAVSKGEKLDLKGIFISLFFGLTIGFGTGFVGTGGGMMMLVVFTAFLGMSLKTAVGTSTFIMTFTALIASVSHIIIHPAIVLERWDALIICIIVATLFSKLSAVFANRVKSETVGLVTGFVLFYLGFVMIVLNYIDYIKQWSFVYEMLEGVKGIAMVIVPYIVVLLLLYKFARVPKALFRKLLHSVAFLLVPLLLHFSGQSWKATVLALGLFALLIYPILMLLEKWKGYRTLFVEKEPGEVKKSLVLLCVADMVIVAISGGIFGKPYVAATAILMWGFGDAAAALVGGRFGRHKVGLLLADHRKTWEGTTAMFVTGFLVGTFALAVLYGIPLGMAVLFATVTAAVGAYVELISHKGLDTITVAGANMVILLILLSFI